jgi:hypothetical protein
LQLIRSQKSDDCGLKDLVLQVATPTPRLGCPNQVQSDILCWQYYLAFPSLLTAAGIDRAVSDRSDRQVKLSRSKPATETEIEIDADLIIQC